MSHEATRNERICQPCFELTLALICVALLMGLATGLFASFYSQ